MNPNTIKLAVTAAAAAAAARFAPKSARKMTPEKLRADLDHLKNIAIKQNERLIQENTKQSETINSMLDQVRFLVTMLEKYNVPLDEFDKIALTNLFNK